MNGRFRVWRWLPLGTIMAVVLSAVLSTAIEGQVNWLLTLGATAMWVGLYFSTVRGGLEEYYDETRARDQNGQNGR